MKKLLFPLLICLSLCSCHSYKNEIVSFDMENYQSDIDLVLSTNERAKLPANFTLNSYYIRENDGFIYTIQIVYKDIEIKNIKAIMLPNDMNDYKESILPCIGYTDSLTLSEKKDVSKNQYSGFNLSYKTDKDDLCFDFFVRDESIDKYNIYVVSSFTLLEE